MAVSIRWLGHSCFKIEAGGYSIVIDPFEPGSVPGLLPIGEEANMVLCSHGHHDHGYKEAVSIIDGEATCESPLKITALPSFHDDKQGALRGENKIHLIEAGSVRIVHFGDVGCMPEPEVMDLLKKADCVMIPVGGHYTVGPEEAKRIIDAIEPGITIPMHYRSEAFGFPVLGTVGDYLRLCHGAEYLDSDTMELGAKSKGRTVVLKYLGK